MAHWSQQPVWPETPWISIAWMLHWRALTQTGASPRAHITVRPMRRPRKRI